ncbi:radical SAM domain protein [Candidatus Magnetomorum sp. HK-1]|nr:radical SAM domain protein [Candidatus Magnetomorum sp. HK-1]
MDILLIQPPIHDFYLTQKRTIPYGLSCITSVLKSEGFETELFDALATNKSKPLAWPDKMTYLKDYYGRPDHSPFALFHQFRHFGYSFQHIGKIARESGAFLIGISSLFTAYSEQALFTAQTVKSWHPNSLIVMGGHHPTHFPQHVLNHSSVDYVIRGEGEESMLLLAKALKNNKPLDKIPGIAFKNSDNNYTINPPAILNDLDKFPFPDISSSNKKFYKRKGKKSVVVLASRGCPMTCSYCAMGDRRWIYRKKSVEKIIDEISVAIGDSESAFIDFEDENISLDRQWFMQLLSRICQEFPSQKLELRAMNGLYPISLDQDMIKAMKKAGFKALNLSVCTFSSKQLERFNRQNSHDKLREILNIAQKIGLSTTAYIIAGAPHQNPFESVDDILTLFKMQTLIGLSVYYPAPGSLDYKALKKSQILPDDFSLMRSACIPISHTTNRTQSITLLRLSRIINFIQDLTNQKIYLPKPSPCKKSEIKLNDRQAAGEQLLSWFFYDGIIRGVDNNEKIYQHKSDLALINYFFKQFQDLKKLCYRSRQGNITF